MRGGYRRRKRVIKVALKLHNFYTHRLWQIHYDVQRVYVSLPEIPSKKVQKCFVFQVMLEDVQFYIEQQQKPSSSPSSSEDGSEQGIPIKNTFCQLEVSVTQWHFFLLKPTLIRPLLAPTSHRILLLPLKTAFQRRKASLPPPPPPPAVSPSPSPGEGKQVRVRQCTVYGGKEGGGGAAKAGSSYFAAQKALLTITTHARKGFPRIKFLVLSMSWGKSAAKRVKS